MNNIIVRLDLNNFFLIIFISLSFVEHAAQDGIVRSYYFNRKLMAETYYIKGVKEGAEKFYYENGNLKFEKNYNQGKLDGWYKEFYENGAPKETTYFSEGRKDGYSRLYYDNGILHAILKYNKGVLVNESFFPYDSTVIFVPIVPEEEKKPLIAKVEEKSPPKKETKQTKKKETQVIPPKDIDNEEELPVFVAVEEMPEPIGGLKAVLEKVIYPDLARRAGVQGEVIITATVDENGDVIDAFVLKGIGLGCDESALNAVKATKFSPGKQRGKPVKTQLNIPIKFVL